MTAGRLDATLVRRHLAALDRAASHLRRYVGRPSEDLQADVEAAWAVERGLHLAAQNALDVATHIAAAAARDSPDYATSIDRLGELAILPRDFARRFRGVAGFRNVLVHGYLELDPARVHEVLNERLDDFAEFARLVEAYLGREGEG